MLFRGEGFGDYKLCFAVQPTWGAASLDYNYFMPFSDAVEAETLAAAAGEGAEAAAAAEDVAVAQAAVLRMTADLRRLKMDQAHLKRRQVRHAETLASSDTRAVLWSGIECAALLVLSMLQMTLFRRAFRAY